MSKEGSSIRSKKTHSAKPYDVSQSFVAKVASRFTGLNPRSLINRWLGPGEASGEPIHPASSNFVNSHPVANLDEDVASDEARPSKRPRLPVDSPFPTNKRFANVTVNEEISPIVPVIANDVAGEPGSSRQINRNPSFSSMKKNATPRRTVKKMSAPTTITTQAIIENSEKFNGGDDCSESSESTSGCSSLVPQAQSSLQSRHNESRRLSLSGAGNLNGSLFPGRSSPKVDLSLVNRRRPSFNATTFNSSRLFNNSAMNSSISRSPFYSGRTMYGGASAYQSTTAGLFAPSPRRAGVTVRPLSTANSSATPALSATAKRILDVLEQFSTPVVDAKRVPVTPGTATAKRKLNRYAELAVPQTSDLLRVKRRERLQDSTCAARQASISSSSASASANATATAAATKHNPQPHYRLGNEGKSSQSSHIGKLKRNEEVDEETVEDVRLPEAVLPIDKLPRIDITVPPPPPPNKTVFEIKSSQSFSLSKAPAVSANHFTFSKPAPAQIDSSRLNSEAKQSFVFSEPCKWSEGSVVKNDSAKSNVSKVMSDSSVGKGMGFSVSKVSSPNSSKASEMPTATSVVDSKTVNHKDSSSWKCSTCMVKNSEESSKCSACGTSKTVPPSSVASPIVFKVPADTWQCKECFIRNKNTVNACAACTSPKPTASKPPPAVSAPSSTPQTSTSVTSSSVNSFGDKFKMPSSKWECKECFVRNDNTAQSCVACCTPKPGAAAAAPQTKKPEVSGFGNMFKKPQGSWECGSCMIQNKPDCSKCVACETPKPGTSASAEKPTAAPAFSFGKPITIEGAGQVTFGFGANTSAPKSESTTPSSNFVFGATNTAATNAKFTFGMPPSDTNDTAPKEKKIKSPEKASNPLQELEKLQQKQAADTTVPFKFGSTVNHSSTDNKSSTLPQTNSLFSADASKSVTKQEADAPKPAMANFMFGSSSSTPATSKPSEPVVTNFAQSSDPAKIVSSEPEKFSSPSVPSPMFGGTSTDKQPISNLFSFGSSNSTASTEKKGPVFGSSSLTASKPAEEPAKPLFGASASSSMFMTPVSEQKNSLFGAASETKSVLGNVSSSSTVPAFGVPSEPAKFGQTAPVPTTTAAGFTFGSAAVSSPFLSAGSADKSKPMFAMPATAPAQSTGFGGFGAPAAEPAKPTPAFTFGASAAQPAPATSNAFAFGATAAPAQNFNFTAKENEQPRPAFQFNAGPSQAATPAFGVQPPPAFDSQPAPSAPAPTPFSFGAQQPAAPAPATNLFSFGQAQQQQQPAAPSTFMFGSAAATPVQPQPTVPTFDPNARPTFNFTAGAPAPTFSATTPSTPVSTTTGRPIKKAIRRTGHMNR
ncbi:nuclear pore complex protein Nup153 isoform X2 [Nilaparvata lugens]|uniref:nuclear pore complex protein Nup153 isoform X2 n=1 Tax=Nilaparvata lugens TaxID=108931 RepID=UPI00193EBE55|nr:nuclear pore complex protein Nup153 isoform X2 [Nilaparvata lugens]